MRRSREAVAPLPWVRDAPSATSTAPNVAVKASFSATASVTLPSALPADTSTSETSSSRASSVRSALHPAATATDSSVSTVVGTMATMASADPSSTFAHSETQGEAATATSVASSPTRAPLLSASPQTSNLTTTADEAAAATADTVTAETTQNGPLYCVEPLTVLGVQNDTPVAFSADGAKLCFATANHGLYVLVWRGGEARRFGISTLLNGHHAAVKAISFHPTDDNILLSTGSEGVFIWDISERRVRHRIEPASPGTAEPGHESDVECLTWAYDGQCLLTGSRDTNIKIWDARKGRYSLIETVYGHKAPVLSIQFHRGMHRFASAGRDSSIKLFDSHTLQPEGLRRRQEDKGITCTLLGSMDGHRGDVTALCWSRDGSILFSGARDNTIMAWDTLSMKAIRTIQDKMQGQAGTHIGDIQRIMVVEPRLMPQPTGASATATTASGDGLMTCSQDGRVNLWRLAPFKKSAGAAAAAVIDTGDGLSDSESAVGSDAMAGGGQPGSSESGRSIAGGLDNEEWDTRTKDILAQILGDDNTVDVLGDEDESDTLLASQALFDEGIGVFHMEMAAGGAVVACSSTENSVRLFSAANLARLVPVQGFHGHMEAVTALRILGNDTDLLSASYDNRISKYNVETVERTLAVKTMSSITSLTTTPLVEGTTPFILAACADYVIRCFSSNPADYGSMINSYHAQWVQSGYAGGSLQIPPHAYEAARYVGHSGRVDALAVNPAGTHFVSGGRDFDMLVWSLGKPRPAVAVAVREASAVPVGVPLCRIDAHFGHVATLSFAEGLSAAEDGGLLASGGNDHAVKVWRINAKGNAKKLWEAARVDQGGHNSAVSAVVWGRGPSAGTLFSGGWDRQLKVWQGADANQSSRSTSGSRLLASMEDHTARISGIDVSRDGRHVVTASIDFSALVYSAQPPYTLLATYLATLTDGALTCISAGDALFATGSESGSVRVWPMVGRSLTIESAGGETMTTRFRSSLEGIDRDAYLLADDTKRDAERIAERTQGVAPVNAVGGAAAGSLMGAVSAEEP